jgi:hypothetical protein
LGLVVVLVGAAAVWCWPAREYVFLAVDEANGLPPSGWTGSEAVSAAWHDGRGKLHVSRGAVRPWHRVVVLHEVDAAGVRVSSRLLAALRFPARVVLDAPVPGLVPAARVLAGPLEVLGVGPDGHLYLRYGGEQIDLAPGQSWAQLRVRRPDGEGLFSPADRAAWQAALDEALARGYPVTRLVITYHGRWPRAGVTRQGKVVPDRPWGWRG